MFAVKPVSIFLLVAGAAVFGSGCVERKLIIRSEPPGGVAVLDNKVVGVTPVTVPFTFYGARQVEVRWDPFLRHVDRFETVTETRYLNAPWYDFFPLDFFFELVWPFTITDERVFEFTLNQRADSESEGSDERLNRIIKRAEAMRAKALKDDEEGP